MKIAPLQKFLATKPIYYKKFDPTRIVKAYALIKDKLKHPKRVQLLGTNGKGSTGRAIAHLAYSCGLSVGHFTSPHILNFKERFWINGKFATTLKLEEAHIWLFENLGKEMAEALSYFEYQALLSFKLFENLDLQIIEAGLGGEFDATSVANYELTVVTPIGFDHSDFLGNSLEEIATTKLKAMAKTALIAKQSDEIVYKIAKEIAKDKATKLHFFKDIYPKSLKAVEEIAKEKAWADYLVENILNATYALDILKIKYNLKDLKTLNLFGRFYQLKQNIIIDVGHNPLAAKAIANALKSKVTLIFNILGDKDATEVLKILKPKIKEVKIIKIQTQRATELKNLETILQNLDIKYSYFDNKLKESENYLVFGSFYVVEEFLKQIGIKEIKS